MPTEKQAWLEYEATLRCPLVNGRRVGIAANRRDLAREWAQMSVAVRDICKDSIRDGVLGNTQRRVRRPLARASMLEVTNMRTAANSNKQAKQYFVLCRQTKTLFEAWRDAAQMATDAWLNLRIEYTRVPPIARSQGQMTSWLNAVQMHNRADVDLLRANTGVDTLNDIIRRDRIYNTPTPNLKVKAEDVPTERFPARNTSFRRDFSADGMPAGDGLHVEVRVWFRVDAQNRIIDRVVRKEQAVYNLHNFKRFKGILPWEVECQRLATVSDAGNVLSSIVPLRETNPATLALWVDRIHKMYKVYMAWCPHGDLDALLEQQRLLGVANNSRELLPEPMIWNVAESLIRGGQLMADVALTNNGDQIIHRDLKHSNVVLNSPNPNNYANYPEPRITDFGQAITTSATDERNPDWWTGACATDGFRAPELERYVDPTTLAPVNATQLLEYTNVWQAGAILRTLVCLDRNPNQSLFLDGANDNTYWVNVVGTPEHAAYSAELLQMIDDMMRYDHTQRPTFAALSARIPGFGRDVSSGMRNSTATPAQRAALAVIYPHDIYALGMAPPVAPAAPPAA